MSRTDTLHRIIHHDRGHLRVTGPPGSGKTRALVERFRRLEAEGRRPAVIAYTREQQDRLVLELFQPGSARLGQLPVYTFHELTSRVLSCADPASRPPLRDVEEGLVLARVLREVGEGLRSDYRNVVASDGFQRTLLDVMHRLLQADVTAERARAASARARSARAADLLGVYAAYRGMLDEKRLVTYYDAAWRAAAAVASGAPDPLEGTGVVLVDDFQDVDAGQCQLVEALAERGAPREVDVFGDPSGARFRFRGTSERFLVEWFGRRFQPTDIALGDECDDVLDAVTRRIARTDAAGTAGLPLFDGPGTRADGPGAVDASLVLADDEVAEARAVAAEIARLLASGAAAPGDIAVIARDRIGNEHRLSRAFADAGLPFDGGARGRYVLDDLVGAWLDLFARGGGAGGERSAAAAAESPLYPILRARYETLRLGERRTADDARDIERIVRFASGGLVEPRTGVFAMERFLEEFVHPVVEALGRDLTEDAIAAAATLLDEWRRYRATIEHVGGRPQLAEFVTRVWRNASAPRVARDPTRVGFYTVREAAGRTFPVAFVVACAEGVFPAVDSSDGFVPYAEVASLLGDDRGVAVEFPQARSREEKLRDEKTLMAVALSRAQRVLRVSAARTIAGEAHAAPSRVLATLADRVGVTSATRTPPPALVAARAVVTAARDGTRADDAVAPVAALWLEGPAPPPAFAVEPFDVSPTRLAGYTACPRRLFFTRVLGIAEEGTVYLAIGSLFHEIMQRLGSEHADGEALVAALASERTDAVVDDVVSRCRDLEPRGSLLERLSRHHLRAMLRGVGDVERGRRGGYRIESTEDNVTFEYGGRRFVGKIDRVDVLEDGSVVIIDYKTSDKIPKRGDTVVGYMSGERGHGRNRHWQIPFYVTAVASDWERAADLFCYYAVPPGGGAYVAGVFVSDDPDRTARVNKLGPAAEKKPAVVSPREISGMMDEAVALCDEIFAEREGFARTDDHGECRSCTFNRLCERRE